MIFSFPFSILKMMTTLGEPLTEEDVQDMIKEVDADGDGKLNIEEFIEVMMREDE